MSRLRILALFAILLWTTAVFAQTPTPVPTPTPTPGPVRFADFNDNLWIEPDDLLEFLPAWRQETTIPEGPRGKVMGTLTLNDRCGNCTTVPKGAWVLLSGDAGQFVARANREGEYEFHEIPTGNYRLVAGVSRGLYCHQIVDPVVVTDGTTTVDTICLVAFCGSDCMPGTWQAIIATTRVLGYGLVEFDPNGTFSGPLTLAKDGSPALDALVNIEGTYQTGQDCTLSFEATLSPREDGGDCLVNGTLSSTSGAITDFCSYAEGEWMGNINDNCDGQMFSGTEIGVYGFTLVTDKAVEDFSAETVPARRTDLKQVSDFSGFDLNDDGTVNSGDTLLVLEQWHLQVPSGPTCTPIPTCTPEPTEGPTEEPTGDPGSATDTLEGWWEMDWVLQEPFTASWTSQNQLGEPGTVQDFDLGDLFDNATASYRFNEDTGEFTMHVEGEVVQAGFAGNFSFDATGELNVPTKTVISNGVFLGTLITNIGNQERRMSGTFTGYKCCVDGNMLDCACNRPPKTSSRGVYHKTALKE